MSTTTQTTQASTGLIRIWAVVNDPDFVALALFCAVGLLVSFYFMTRFPVDDFLAPWL